jgi:hypothetical protein
MFRWGFETKKLSKVWAEFAEILQPPTFSKAKATPYVFCNHYCIVLSHPNHNAEKSPSSMMKHLKGCTPYQKSSRSRNDEGISSDGQTLLELLNPDAFNKNQVMSCDRLKEAVLRIIISGNLPFSFADNAELQSLLKDAYPDSPPPNRK